MKHKIKIYSTETCIWCDKAKEFLKEHNIEFEEVDVNEDQEAGKEMVEKSGQRGVPVLDIDGEIVVGFNLTKIKELLEIG